MLALIVLIDSGVTYVSMGELAGVGSKRFSRAEIGRQARASTAPWIGSRVHFREHAGQPFMSKITFPTTAKIGRTVPFSA